MGPGPAQQPAREAERGGAERDPHRVVRHPRRAVLVHGPLRRRRRRTRTPAGTYSTTTRYLCNFIAELG